MTQYESTEKGMTVFLNLGLEVCKGFILTKCFGIDPVDHLSPQWWDPLGRLSQSYKEPLAFATHSLRLLPLTSDNFNLSLLYHLNIQLPVIH